MQHPMPQAEAQCKVGTEVRARQSDFRTKIAEDLECSAIGAQPCGINIIPFHLLRYLQLDQLESTFLCLGGSAHHFIQESRIIHSRTLSCPPCFVFEGKIC